jgi:hypothetical protein
MEHPKDHKKTEKPEESTPEAWLLPLNSTLFLKTKNFFVARLPKDEL